MYDMFLMMFSNCTDEDGNVHDMAGPTWREGVFVCSCSHACSVSWMDCNDKGPDHIRWRQVAKECELQGTMKLQCNKT